jgi:thiol-disulfide isomerase/thioredoxin
MLADLQDALNPENLNIADNVGEETLELLGEECVKGFKLDLESREKWITENESWMKLATQYKESKTFPWPGAANVKFPLVTTAAMQFSARAYPSLVPNQKPVKAVMVGKEGDDIVNLTRSISDHMNYQLMYEMDGWEEDMDKLCMILPITGCAFKKTYYDPVHKRNVSELILAKDLVVNYWASWCPPCVREMPMFIRAQEALRDNGVQFVGIALDRVQDVENFLIDHPVNYPILIGNTEAVALSKQLGNRIEGLPFTVIFDRQGRRVFSRIGEVTSEDLKTQIDALTETGDWQQSRS